MAGERMIYIKSEKEIEGFKEAGRIANKILNTLISKVETGITTKKLDEIAREEFKKHNAIPTFLNYEGFPATICTSVNNVLVHGIPDNTLLKENDIISIDVGATIDGFIGDTADTIEIGFSQKNQELISLCKNALYSAIDVARAGNKLSRIAEAVSKVAKRNRYYIPEEYGGHGISRNVLHDDPYVPNIPDYENDLTLRPGMVIAIEPMFMEGDKLISKDWDVFSNANTAHCEHTILITEDDPIILTGVKFEGTAYYF